MSRPATPLPLPRPMSHWQRLRLSQLSTLLLLLGRRRPPIRLLVPQLLRSRRQLHCQQLLLLMVVVVLLLLLLFLVVLLLLLPRLTSSKLSCRCSCTPSTRRAGSFARWTRCGAGIGCWSTALSHLVSAVAPAAQQQEEPEPETIGAPSSWRCSACWVSSRTQTRTRPPTPSCAGRGRCSGGGAHDGEQQQEEERLFREKKKTKKKKLKETQRYQAAAAATTTPSRSTIHFILCIYLFVRFVFHIFIRGCESVREPQSFSRACHTLMISASRIYHDFCFRRQSGA